MRGHLDLAHRGVADALALGKGPARPMRGAARRALERLDHDGFHHVVSDAASRAGTGGIGQPVQRVRREALAPLTYRDRLQSSSAAISVCVRSPAAQASTIFDRRANACDDE